MTTRRLLDFFFFFFNDTATTEIYTLSLHDALPISRPSITRTFIPRTSTGAWPTSAGSPATPTSSTARWRSLQRSEEHTSELQSRLHLVCRLLLEKKKKKTNELVTVDTNNPDALL